MFNNNQLNRKQKKEMWPTEQERKLFQLAKRGATLAEACEMFPERTEHAIKDKLHRMGWGHKNGVIGKSNSWSN